MLTTKKYIPEAHIAESIRRCRVGMAARLRDAGEVGKLRRRRCILGACHVLPRRVCLLYVRLRPIELQLPDCFWG